MEITILDKSFAIVSIFDEWESLLWSSRYNSEGDFEIYTRFSYDLLGIFQKEYYLKLRGSSTTMMVENIEVSSIPESGDYITITGTDLKSILDRRTFEADVNLSGPFVSEIQTKVINALFISPTDPNRTIPNFVMDPVLDDDILAMTIDRPIEAGANPYTVLESIMVESDLGFDLYLDDENVFHFTIYKGEDRSFTQVANPYVIFSPEFENLLSSTYVDSNRGKRTHAFVKGPSSSKVVGDLTLTGLERREIFLQVNTNNATQQDQLGKEELKHYDILESFSGEADVRGNFVYGTDFFMGDIVQIRDKYGLEGRVRVTELTTVSAKDGYTTYPTFVKVEEEEEI